MENKSKKIKNANSIRSSHVVPAGNIKELALIYHRYKVKHDRLLRENSILKEEVTELKNFKHKWEKCEKYRKALLKSIKSGRNQVVIQCDCASDKVGTLQKMVSVLEKEKRDLELSKNNDIERLKITVLDFIGKFNDADEKFLKYRNLWEEQLEEIKNLERKVMRTKGLLIDSNQRYVQMQREKTEDLKKYKQNLLEKDSKIDEKNSEISELEGKVKFLNDKNQNNLDLINRLYEEVRNLKGKTSLTNIEAQFRKKASESESKIIELEGKLTEVNEEFKRCKISSDQQRNEINSLKLAEQNSLNEILKLKRELVEVNKKLSESNQRYLQCSALSDKRCTEIESMKKTIKDLNLDKHCHLNEITQLKSALVEMKQKCAQYKASADTKDTEVNQLQEQINIKDTEVNRLQEQINIKDTEVNQLQEQINIKDTEVNQLQEQINIMQLKVAQSLERVAEKRPLDQSDTCVTKKVKSLQSSEAVVSLVDNNEIVTPAVDCVTVTTNLVGHEEDSCDSNFSCDIVSLLNSDEYRRLTFSRDLVLPINDCASTQTDNSIVENASGRTFNCVVTDASTHTENFIVTDASLQTEKITAKNNSVQTCSSPAKNASEQTDNVIVKNGSAQTQDSSVTDASAQTENRAVENNSVHIDGSDINNPRVQTGNLCDFVPVMQSTTQDIPSNKIALKRHIIPVMPAFKTKLKSPKKTSRYIPMYKKQECKPFKSACINITKPAMSAKTLLGDVPGEKLPVTPRNLTYPNKKTILDKTTHLNFRKSSFGMCLRNGKEFSSLGNEIPEKYVKERYPKDNVKECTPEDNVKESTPKYYEKMIIPKDNAKESVPKDNMKKSAPKDTVKVSIPKDTVKESIPKDNVKKSIPKDIVKEGTPKNNEKKSHADSDTSSNNRKQSSGMCLRSCKEESKFENKTDKNNVKESNPKANEKESIPKNNEKESAPKDNVKESILKNNVKKSISKDNVKESAPKNNEKESHADVDTLSNNRKQSSGMCLRSHKEESKLENKTNMNNVNERIPKNNEKQSIPKNNEEESASKDNVKESIPKDNVKESIPKDNVKESDPKNNEKESHADIDTLSNNRKQSSGMCLRSRKEESKLENKTNMNNVKERIPKNNEKESNPENNEEESASKDNVKENIPKDNVKESIPKDNVKESILKNNVKKSIPKDNVKESAPKNNEKESHADVDTLSNNRKQSSGMCLRSRKEESKLENETNKINVKESIPKNNEKGSIPGDNVKESAPKDNEKVSHADSDTLLNNRKTNSGMCLRSRKEESKLENETTKDNVKESILEGNIKKCVHKEYEKECVLKEYVNKNCAESATLTTKTHKKSRKSKRLKRLNNLNPKDKKFRQLYTMQARVDVSNLSLKPVAFKILVPKDEHCSKNQKSSEECYDSSEILKCPLPTITKPERTDVTCANDTGNIQTEDNDSDMFSENENLVIVSDDEMLSNSTNVTEKDVDKECTDIFNNTEKLTSEAKYVTEINKNMLVGIKSSGIEIKSQDEIPSVVSSEVQNDIVTSTLHTVDNRISEITASAKPAVCFISAEETAKTKSEDEISSVISMDTEDNAMVADNRFSDAEIPVMESDRMAVAVENFDLQRETFKVVSDIVAKNTEDTVASSFSNGNMISETAEAISRNFNMETVVDGQTVLPFSSQIKKNRGRTAVSFITAEETVKTKSEDKISSVISMDTEDNAMVADNICSDAVSDAAGKKVLSAVPENYTIPNMKPKRIAHVPKAPDSLLSDSLYFPCKSFGALPESSKGNKKIKKPSKLKTMKKRLSKTCSTLWRNSSEKDPKIINDLVLQKTKADICNDTNVLSQNSNMSKSVTLQKSNSHERLHDKAKPDERNVSESNDSQLLSTEQLPSSSETTMLTCAIGLFEDLPGENDYVKSLELHESKVTMNPEEKFEEFSFYQSSIVDKPIRKYERNVMKGKSKVSQQENAKETCEALNFLLDRKELTVSKVTDQKCVNYSVPTTINSITKHELESTLTTVSHVSDIQNDNINASKNNIFQTKESATISKVPATHDRSQTTVKSLLTAVSHVSDIPNDNINASYSNIFQTKESATISKVPATHDRSQTTDHVSVLLKNSQSYFTKSESESKNKFKIHSKKKSMISTVQDCRSQTEQIYNKSPSCDNSSNFLKTLLSRNVLNSDEKLSTLSSDVNREKIEKLSTSLLLPRESENISKDFNKQIPTNFSFYTSSANSGDYEVDMSANESVSGKYVFNKNVSREVSGPYDIEMNTSQKVSFEKHEVQTNKAFSSLSETSVKPVNVTAASTSRKAQEVRQVRQLSRNEIVQRNRDVFMKLVRKSKKFGNYSSNMRLLGKDDTLPKVLIIMDAFDEIHKPNVNYYNLHLRLKDINSNILFACTIFALEELCNQKTLNALITFYLKWRKNDIPYLLDHIHEKLMKLKPPPLTLLVVKNLCSFYVKLSASTKDYSRLEVLIFDALYCMQHAADVVIGEFLNVCSDYLPHASKANDDPWVLVLVHSILSVKLNFVNKNPLVNIEEVKEKLETVYGYQRGEHNFTEIVKILFNKLRANELRKLESSFLIHCKRVSWFQSYSFVINREMFPIIDAWIKGDRVLSDEAMAMLIRLLGYLARAIDIRNGKEQIHAITRKLQRMCNVENMPQIIAKALFITLVSHGRQDFEGVLDCVLNWKWELDNFNAVKSFLTYRKLPYWYQKFRTSKVASVED